MQQSGFVNLNTVKEIIDVFCVPSPVFLWWITFIVCIVDATMVSMTIYIQNLVKFTKQLIYARAYKQPLVMTLVYANQPSPCNTLPVGNIKVELHAQ